MVNISSVNFVLFSFVIVCLCLFPVAECKRRWKSNRDYFIRCTKNGSGVADSRLNFLISQIKSGKCVSIIISFNRFLCATVAEAESARCKKLTFK